MNIYKLSNSLSFLFTALSVDADAPSGSISGLIQQDGHFLHVDSSANLCDDDSLYLTDSTTGQQLTYIGKS